MNRQEAHRGIFKKQPDIIGDSQPQRLYLRFPNIRHTPLGCLFNVCPVEHEDYPKLILYGNY
jgi:hypothetical protein